MDIPNDLPASLVLLLYSDLIVEYVVKEQQKHKGNPPLAL